MAHMNKICLIGNLCKMPKLRVTPSGKDICDLLIAVNRKSGATDFLPVIVWGKDAVSCSERLKTGSLVALTGKVQSRNYEKSDGSRHVAIELVAEEIEFLDKLLKGYSIKEVEDVLKTSELSEEDVKGLLEELKNVRSLEAPIDGTDDDVPLADIDAE